MKEMKVVVRFVVRQRSVPSSAVPIGSAARERQLSHTAPVRDQHRRSVASVLPRETSSPTKRPAVVVKVELANRLKSRRGRYPRRYNGEASVVPWSLVVSAARRFGKQHRKPFARWCRSADQQQPDITGGWSGGM